MIEKTFTLQCFRQTAADPLDATARIQRGKVGALSGTGRLSRKILCIVEKPERDLLLKLCRA